MATPSYGSRRAVVACTDVAQRSAAGSVTTRGGFGPEVDRAVVVALLVAAVGLGRSALAPASLWRDDAWVALVHRAPLTDALRMGVTSPGFSLGLRLWLTVVGFSELRAQIPEFAAFVLTPALLYMFARRVGLQWPVAILAAGLLLTAPPFVAVAGRVKSYSFDALAGVLSMWLAWLVVEQPESDLRWAALGVGAAVLTAVTSSVAGVVVGGFVVALIVAWKAHALFRRRVVAAVGGYAAFGLLWWLFFISRATTPSLKVSFGGAMIPGRPGQSRWAGVYARLGDLAGHFTRLAVHHVPVALAFLAVAVAIGTARRLELTLLLIAPVVIAVILAIKKVAPLGGGAPISANGSRIDVHLYPSVALLFAMGFVDLLTVGSELRLVHRLAAPVLTVVVVGGLLLTARTSTYPQEDTKALIQEAERSIRPGDLLVVQTDARYAFGLYSRAPIRIVFSRRFESGFTVATSEPDVLVMGGGRTEDGNSDAAVLGLIKVPPPPPPPTAGRVIVVSSTYFSAPTGVDKWLTSGAYSLASERLEPGAVLQLWTRTPA
jgi:hypothetical protein